MIKEIRREIEKIEESTLRLKRLAQDNPAIQRNAEAIMTFTYLLKFITPVSSNTKFAQGEPT
jgi:hypothetical protein